MCVWGGGEGEGGGGGGNALIVCNIDHHALLLELEWYDKIVMVQEPFYNHMYGFLIYTHYLIVQTAPKPNP